MRPNFLRKKGIASTIGGTLTDLLTDHDTRKDVTLVNNRSISRFTKGTISFTGLAHQRTYLTGDCMRMHMVAKDPWDVNLIKAGSEDSSLFALSRVE